MAESLQKICQCKNSKLGLLRGVCVHHSLHLALEFISWRRKPSISVLTFMRDRREMQRVIRGENDNSPGGIRCGFCNRCSRQQFLQQSPIQGEAESEAVLPNSAPMEHELATVIEAWPTLPEPIKAGILAMVQAASSVG